MKKGYHKTKSGKMAKKGLYYNINQRKKKGVSRSKTKSTISPKAYSRMKSGFKKSQAQLVKKKAGMMVGKKNFGRKILRLLGILVSANIAIKT